MRYCVTACLLFLSHCLAAAGGYQQWQFGMTQEQVKSVGNPSRYYAFKNGDLGAGAVPFEGGKALLSFYFTHGYMVRAMLITYRGDDASLARQAWVNAYAHLARVCGDVESVSAGQGAMPLEAVLAAYDEAVPALAPGGRHQMGCLHMPAEQRIWVSLTHHIQQDVMVAVNYGKP